jgi:dipeptidase E
MALSSKLRAIPPRLRGVFAGSGSDAFNDARVCEEALRLTGKASAPSTVTLAYLGTATYDLQPSMVRQTAWFAEQGCIVHAVVVGRQDTLTAEDGLKAKKILVEADIVLVSGGNTLYAMQRWHLAGITDTLRDCMERGAVMCGGSAGAICWFDAGHSDSLDPTTFRAPMISAAETGSAVPAGSPQNKDESSQAPADDAARKPWRYARVAGLGFLPGLVCPHFDKTQSNGVPRAEDFDGMLLRHAGESGIGIDHWAALIVEGEQYRVLSLPGYPGSVGNCEAGAMDTVASATVVPKQGGIPGIWVKRVRGRGDTLSIETALAPWQGVLSDILAEPESVQEDPLEAEGMRLNPAA